MNLCMTLLSSKLHIDILLPMQLISARAALEPQSTVGAADSVEVEARSRSATSTHACGVVCWRESNIYQINSYIY